MRLKPFLLAPLALLTILIFTTCGELFEKDIHDKNLKVYAPPDSLQTDILTQTFWWKEIKGARNYRLQIVSPRFSYINQLVVDTSVKGDKFTYTLSPGTYEWRIRGENNGYETDYVTRTLIIDSTDDLSNQVMVLNSPVNNLITNQQLIQFKWQSISIANDYRFEIAQPDFSGSTVTDITTPADTFSYFLEEGIYQWRVRGQNNLSVTAYTTRSFTIDTTSPSAPVLNNPADGATVQDTAVLQWSSNANILRDTLYIYPDSFTFVPVSRFATKKEEWEYIDVLGSYWWDVRSVDSAGNVSPYSEFRKFIIQ